MNPTIRAWTWLIACGFALAIAAVNAAEPMVVPVEGEPFAALLTYAADNKLEFAHGATKRTLEVSDLVRYGDFLEPRRGPIWLLVDGGLLVADVLELNKETLRGDSKILGKLSLPLGKVSGILMRPPSDRSRRDTLMKSLAAVQGDTDRLILDNGDELTGTIEAISGESIALVAATKRIEVELPRVAAIAFNPSLAEKSRLPTRYLVLGFSDGSRVLTESIGADAKNITFGLFGVEQKTRASALVGLQVFGGRATYLSGLKESSFKHVPYLQLAWPLDKNANVLGQPLRAGGKQYLNGLGMHTAARVAYKLEGPYQEFQAELAIDDSAEGRGSAVCSVFVDDGSGKWQPKYTSPVIRGGEPPVPVRVDLTGVKAISLLADFADHGDELDHVDWLNARLVKK